MTMGNKLRPNYRQWRRSFIFGDSDWTFFQVGYPVATPKDGNTEVCVGGAGGGGGGRGGRKAHKTPPFWECGSKIQPVEHDDGPVAPGTVLHPVHTVLAE